MFKLTLAAVLLVLGSSLHAQCDSTILTNGDFEQGAFTDWWNWHDNSETSYSFATSDDSFSGDSSAVINVLESTDLIPGGQGGEFNSRPQTNPVVGGQFYEISFYGKSTLPDTRLPIYIKDENDGWVQLFSDVAVVGTEWTLFSTTWQADTDRPDVHLELKTYNAEFDQPYSVFFDAVTFCPVEIATNTCEGNLVTNPGFEGGIETDWWNYDGGEASDYTFSTAAEGRVGNASARVSVNKPTADLNGSGEFNSRPQTASAVVAGQNYRVTVWAKSSIENAGIQVFVKDEFDGWTTIGNADFTVGTEWAPHTFVFENTTDRDDVHVELKVFTEGATEAYDVWFDEVSICETDDTPGEDVEEPTPTFFGTTALSGSCSVNLASEFSLEDLTNDGLGWDIWDGSDDEERATFELDPILPYSGDNSMRISVFENNDVAEFHHRFGNDLELTAGEEYTVSLWMRADLSETDSVRAFTRATRDTDWSAQFAVDFVTTVNEWRNYVYTFTADSDWDNGFLEIKFYRVNDFDGAYNVWVDDIQFCSRNDATITSNTSLETLGLEFNLFPNPVAYGNATLNVTSDVVLNGADVEISDLHGRTIWNQRRTIGIGRQSISLPTNDLKSGLYLVRVQHGGKFQTLKLNVVRRP